jgi:hypothetical protein
MKSTTPDTMNTQTYLFENSDKIPESVYIDLMNSLKKDFDTNRNRGVRVPRRPDH